MSAKSDFRHRTATTAALIAYTVTIPAANWMIDHVGDPTFPGGPHVIPVGFGYQAPSGVLLIGAALVARDVVQRLAGKWAAVAAIAVGVALSYVLANPAIATASAIAFAIGELVDLAVYTPLQRRHLTAAVIASGVVGGIFDTFLFLWIAFGSVEFWQGQVLGKTWMALLGGIGIWLARRAVPVRLLPEGA